MIKRIIYFTEEQYEYLRQRAFDERSNMCRLVRDVVEKDMKRFKENLINVSNNQKI